MSQLITINSGILSGTPVFTGTRVPIKNLFDYLETGETVDEFIIDFPSVTKEQAIQLIETAEKLLLTATETLNENPA